jgi:hypothetical protein
MMAEITAAGENNNPESDKLDDIIAQLLVKMS